MSGADLLRRLTQADCPVCGAICEASDLSPAAHRMWARRHADKTGHTTLVESVAVRSYRPASKEADDA